MPPPFGLMHDTHGKPFKVQRHCQIFPNEVGFEHKRILICSGIIRMLSQQPRLKTHAEGAAAVEPLPGTGSRPANHHLQAPLAQQRKRRFAMLAFACSTYPTSLEIFMHSALLV